MIFVFKSARLTICSAIFLTLFSIGGFVLPEPCLISAHAEPGKLEKAKFQSFVFPTRAPVAKISYSLEFFGRDGKKLLRKELVIAKGRVQLPVNVDLYIELSYDALENLQSLEQLYDCQVAKVSADYLDFGDNHMHYLTGFKSLRFLNLIDTDVTDRSLPLIAKLSKVQVLRLNKTNITGSGFDSLTKLPDLHDISLEGIDLKPGNIDKLRPIMPRLLAFNISRTNLSKKDAIILKDLKIIIDLAINGNKQLDNDCISYLSHLNTLDSLAVNDTAINDKCLPQLLKLPHLKIVKIRDQTFWTNPKHKTKYDGVSFVDIERLGSMPVEICAPLK